MPELPEAEAQRRLLERCVVGQTIERVETKEQGGGARDGQLDDKVLDGDIDALAGARVVAAKRKGKQLWLELDKGKTKHCLLIHLGMTGSCVIKGEAPPSYKAFSIDDAFPPKYTKLELVMDDGTRLAYCDPRRFGRIKLRGAEPEELAALAPDALEAPAVAGMRSALSSKSAPIKAVLLDQSAAVWKSTSTSDAPDNSLLSHLLARTRPLLSPTSGEEPASPHHRAGVASMAWRSTRRVSTSASRILIHTGRRSCVGSATGSRTKYSTCRASTLRRPPRRSRRTK